ncbi:MAG: hypothetical protein BWY77_00342 [bacterium ADurb.Bin431]|nr:MAG: hypothetical protein BWY77_00342 [bacterium ADurb.Bin431]
MAEAEGIDRHRDPRSQVLEFGFDGLIAVHGDGGDRIVRREDEHTLPASQLPAGFRHSGQGHHRSGCIGPARRIESDHTLALGQHGEQALVGRDLPAQIPHRPAVVGGAADRRVHCQPVIKGRRIVIEGIDRQVVAAGDLTAVELGDLGVEKVGVAQRGGAVDLDRGRGGAALVGKDAVLDLNVLDIPGIEDALVLAVGDRIKGAVVDPDHRIGVLDVEGFASDLDEGAVLQFEIFDFRSLVGALAQDDGLVVGVAEDAVAEEDGVGNGELMAAQKGFLGIVQPAILDLESEMEGVGCGSDILRADDVFDKGGATLFGAAIEV